MDRGGRLCLLVAHLFCRYSLRRPCGDDLPQPRSDSRTSSPCWDLLEALSGPTELGLGFSRSLHLWTGPDSRLRRPQNCRPRRRVPGRLAGSSYVPPSDDSLVGTPEWHNIFATLRHHCAAFISNEVAPQNRPARWPGGSLSALPVDTNRGGCCCKHNARRSASVADFTVASTPSTSPAGPIRHPSAHKIDRDDRGDRAREVVPNLDQACAGDHAQVGAEVVLRRWGENNLLAAALVQPDGCR